MNSKSKDKLEHLIKKGAKIPNPESVCIGEEVSIERMAGQGVVIYPGCKVFGEKTLIMQGARLGYEAPVTVENCQIGPNVELRGGFFKKSTFLHEANLSSGALVRDGCLLEEQANGAHSVGLKQTILFPFVTLGSLINFCDCLMAGGTSRKNHSEVGSSYIHFNYTPNQDKATPSLIGDVSHGVMLNRPPIFLGGQGGIVGPVRIAYGTVIAAGVICRKDVAMEGKLLARQELPERFKDVTGQTMDFHPGIYWRVKGQINNNVHYIANLIALRHWYEKVRALFFKGDSMVEALYEGAVEKIQMAIEERIKRLKALAQKMPESVNKYRKMMNGQANEKLVNQKQTFFERWDDLEIMFEKHLALAGDPMVLDPFLDDLQKQMKETGNDYIATIQGLDKAVSQKGTTWLQSIVDTINDEAIEILTPSQ